MTHYATCTNCAVNKSTCTRRNAIAAGLRGLSVYSLKFRCADRKAQFQEGQRVEFRWTVWYGADDGDEMFFNGTVIRETGTKFLVQVDPDIVADRDEPDPRNVFKKNDQLLIKVRPADMRAIEEPTRSVCQACLHVDGSGFDRCWRYEDGPYSQTPDGCLRPPIGGAS